MPAPTVPKRSAIITYNRYGRGKIHVGALIVPYTLFATPQKKRKRKEARKMSLRYCPIPKFIDVTPLVFNGSGTDFAPVSTPVFPAGAPVPEALINLTLCGVFTVAPGILHARIVDENNDIVCALRDVPTPAAPTLVVIADLLTAIAGRGGLKLQIAASNACTFTPAALGSSGLVTWDE
jgi:hypothetical protein